MDLGILPGGSFNMARVAAGNDRLESLRLPGVRFGLMAHGIVRVSKPDDLMTLLSWQREMGYPPDEEED